ncbi:hypothetical protein AB0D34_35300 [Streptomyces sp. NPDC048420]|uniref:SCO2400 family protein n=1 Tax=Streptomyces sp. NPDC048420 TaxID=3155755 RepID=UPI003436D791
MVQSTQEDQMDYCSSCRRHLNGALACPGCGAYAPDIAPPVQYLSTAGASAAPVWDEAPTWHDAGRHEDPVTGTDSPELPSDDVADGPVVSEGRAARRRQRARWKKNQRKAVVATAVALVGGGLTVSAMSQQSNARPQAATSPDNHAMGVSELPTSDDTPTVATPAEAHQASKTTSSTGSGKHRRTADSVSTTTGTSVHTDSAASPAPTATTASQPQSQSRTTLSTTVSADVGTTGTKTEPTPSSTATDTTATTTTTTTTTTGTDSSSGSQTTTPSSSDSDPSGLCVLNLLCIS